RAEPGLDAEACDATEPELGATSCTPAAAEVTRSASGTTLRLCQTTPVRCRISPGDILLCAPPESPAGSCPTTVSDDCSQPYVIESAMINNGRRNFICVTSMNRTRAKSLEFIGSPPGVPRVFAPGVSSRSAASTRRRG